MPLGFNIECPKCHADRTLLDTTFGLPGHIDPRFNKDCPESINTKSALPVRLVLCPRCHYLEMYHDVGLDNLG
jgi:ssDNA-binding Zn-finger/Zn-ribbon topoisomerase 1